MIYKARVLDTSMFPSNGTIKIRIFEKFHGKYDNADLSEHPEIINDMSDITEDNKEINVISYDKYAYVSSSFGGGYDYGVFYLPQVNSVGIVSDLGDTTSVNNHSYVWLGCIYDVSSNNDTEEINVPSLETYDSNGIVNGAYDQDLLNSLVLKTRSTYLNPDNIQASVDDINWKKRPMENMVVINKNKIMLYHNIIGSNDKIYGYSEISMDKSGITITKTDETIDSSITFDEQSRISIYRKETDGDKEKKVSIQMNTGSELETYICEGDDSTSIIQSSSGIDFEVKDTSIKLEGEDIDIKSKSTVSIHAETIRLNDGQNPVAVIIGSPDSEGGGIQQAIGVYA